MAPIDILKKGRFCILLHRVVVVCYNGLIKNINGQMQMQNNNFNVTVTEATRQLKMPQKQFVAWRNGTLQIEGVTHPNFKIGSGRNYRYCQTSLDATAAALKMDNYYPLPTEDFDVWTATTIAKLGRIPFFAQAVVKPVKFQTNQGLFEIALADEYVSGVSVSARNVIGRHVGKLVDIKTLESKFEFPGAQFSVKIISLGKQTNTEYKTLKIGAIMRVNDQMMNGAGDWVALTKSNLELSHIVGAHTRDVRRLVRG